MLLLAQYAKRQLREVNNSCLLTNSSKAAHPVRPDLVYQCIIFAVCSMFQMRIVDFADMLQTSINEKIKVCKGEVHEEIEALEWVQGQIHHLVINNERKDMKIRI